MTGKSPVFRDIEVEWVDKYGKIQKEWVSTEEVTIWDSIREAKRTISNREGRETELRVRTGKGVIRTKS